MGKVLPPAEFKVSVVALRCLNNVLGGMSFVVLARITGSQKAEEKKGEEERLIEVTEERKNLLHSHLSTGLAGTFGYMAPEYIIHGKLTEKADVYGYGVVVLEIITGQKNHNSAATSAEGHSLTSMVWQHFNSKTLINLLDPHLQGIFSEEEALKIFHIGLLCTQSSPSLRPPMWKVVEMLTGKPKELPVPTHPPFINVEGAEIQSECSDTSYPLSSSSKNSHSVNQMSVSTVMGEVVSSECGLRACIQTYAYVLNACVY